MFVSSWHAIKYICFLAIALSFFSVLIIFYACSNQKCTFNLFNSPYYSVYWHKLKANRQLLGNRSLFSLKQSDNALESNKQFPVAQSDFNIEASDVIVFLHIQNTGGSVFARHIVEDLDLEKPCKCKKNRRICHCYRPNKYGSTWFFSRYTTGWKCGVHPDWSELSSCVDRVMDEEEGKPLKRRYFFITMLRDPVKRFLSEYWHVRQGQSWPSSRHWCGGVEATPEELPTCFNDSNLQALTVNDFLKCSYNLAINRQTRMLSDLALVGCYNSSSLPKEDRDLVISASAKKNLHMLSFFGLAEFPKVSQYMFERIFGLNFKVKSHVSRNSLHRSVRRKLFKEISAKDVENIKLANHMDMELYHYAKELLFVRFEKMKNADPAFGNDFGSFERSNFSAENWADKEDFLDNLLDSD